MLIDTHAHLDHLENLKEAFDRAKVEGVESIVAVSEDLESSAKNLKISREFDLPKVHVAMGIHPSEASRDAVVEVAESIRKNKGEIVAIGEIGLDFWYKWVRKDEEKKEEQKEVFRALLNLSKELDLPVIIHSRGAWKHCLEIVKDVGIKKAEFHWYSGPIDILEEILSEGFYVSATPSLGYSPEARAAISHSPIEQILIETDTPVYYRNRETGDGFKSEPKDVFRTLDLLCELKGLGKEEASSIVNANAKKFFNI